MILNCGDRVMIKAVPEDGFPTEAGPYSVVLVNQRQGMAILAAMPGCQSMGRDVPCGRTTECGMAALRPTTAMDDVRAAVHCMTNEERQKVRDLLMEKMKEGDRG